MNSSNWVYLVLGIVVGVTIDWLFRRWRGSNLYQISSVEELKQTQLAYKMATEMSQFKAGFLARTTHELRSPLNGLIGLHQLILSNLCENPEEEREFITQAHERAQKLVKLMDEILSIARTEHGTNKLDIQSRPLAEILQEVYKVTYLLAANRNFPFQLLLPSQEIHVLADHRWLRQVLLSLVDSCITHMEQGSICISADSSLKDDVRIWLDVPSHCIFQSEPKDLIKSLDILEQTNDQDGKISVGMKLLLNQTLLEVIGGKLEILSSPTKLQPDEDYTRLQVSIRQVIPETALSLEEK